MVQGGMSRWDVRDRPVLGDTQRRAPHGGPVAGDGLLVGDAGRFGGLRGEFVHDGPQDGEFHVGVSVMRRVTDSSRVCSA